MDSSDIERDATSHAVFSVAQVFSSLTELKAAVGKYQQDKLCVLSKADTRTIEAAQKKCPNKSLNRDLKYCEAKFVCHHGGTYKSGRGKGMRPNQSTAKTGCPFKLQFWSTLDGQMLQLRNSTLEHNHKLSAEVYHHHPKQRKLDSKDIKTASAMLKLDPNRKLVRQHFVEKTGKPIVMKDIHHSNYRWC